MRQIRSVENRFRRALEGSYTPADGQPSAAALMRTELCLYLLAGVAEGQAAAGTADKYVRLTVFLAAVLFLVGIGSRFPVRAARYGLVCVAAVLLLVSVVQLLTLPGPPA